MGHIGITAIPTVWAIFPTLHAVHGAGFAYGLWHYLRHRDWPDEPERVPARKANLRAV